MVVVYERVAEILLVDALRDQGRTVVSNLRRDNLLHDGIAVRGWTVVGAVQCRCQQLGGFEYQASPRSAYSSHISLSSLLQLVSPLAVLFSSREARLPS